MRIQYKIPGWEPARAPLSGDSEAVPSPFRARLTAAAAAPSAVSWRRLLRLDAAPAAVTLEKPIRYNALVIDPERDRVEMRRLIERHSLEAGPSPVEDPAKESVRKMIMLLLDLQSGEDDLWALMLQQERG
jgi:hypothetical protein